MKRGWSDQVVAVEVKSNLKFVLAFRATAEKRRNVEVKSVSDRRRPNRLVPWESDYQHQPDPIARKGSYKIPLSLGYIDG
ncbi:hypothetical protein F2Q69_00036549 [Brassica cretica]|uniref:Uncharacterized protein n=1 Tax=Brassica cretica TaxID=69181 RepID=A0A8S9SRA2_BRACR|nr:hypothetical protein F2Q69_00036549 [Brassica cretica]